jgi:hypothetical protein
MLNYRWCQPVVEAAAPRQHGRHSFKRVRGNGMIELQWGKKYRVSAFLLCLMGVLLSACANKSVSGQLSGKSKHWEVALAYQYHDDSDGSEKVTVKYLGKDVLVVGNVLVKIKDSGNNTTNHQNVMLDEKGTAIIESVVQPNANPEKKNVQVELQWNGFKEVVSLK